MHLGEGGAEEVELTLGLTAGHLVFARRLLSTRILEGDPPGRPVAEFVFTYEDGVQHTHTIRERFEVSALPTPWGQLPFLALPDTPDSLPPDRWVGEFGAIGYMLTLVEGSLAYIRELSHQHPAERVTHHHGGDHQVYLERPFLEARAALELRLGT